LSGIGYAFDSLGSPHPLALPTSFCRRHSGSRRCLRDPERPAQPPALPLRAAYGWNAWCGKSQNTLYFWNRPSPNLCKSCLLTFADKLDFGCVGATSATDVPTLSFTGGQKRVDVSLNESQMSGHAGLRCWRALQSRLSVHWDEPTTLSS
jgi:hypothetical protein